MTLDPNDPHVGNGLLTAAEAAARCSISIYTFNEKARAGLIPRVQLGGRKGVRYLVEDVDAFILARREQ